MTTNTSIAKVSSVKELVTNDFFRNQIGEALPGNLTLTRYMRCLATQVQKNPKLMGCTPDSVRASAITCAQMGVEPNGRDAHLIPYGQECTLIIDYKGLVKLALQSGEISNIHADVICENDIFSYDKGRIAVHQIDFKKPRGKVYAVYALANFKDGTEKAEVMHLDEVESIRNRSRAGQSGPWKTDYNEMAKKTALRRLSKWLPLSPDIHDRITAEDAQTVQETKQEMPSPGFMDTDEEDDVPMEDAIPVESEPVEEEKPAKKKAAKKATAKKAAKSTLFPEPHGQLQRILAFAKADGVTEEQIAAFAKDRDFSLDDIDVCSQLADGWGNLVDEIKEF